MKCCSVTPIKLFTSNFPYCTPPDLPIPTMRHSTKGDKNATGIIPSAGLNDETFYMTASFTRAQRMPTSALPKAKPAQTQQEPKAFCMSERLPFRNGNTYIASFLYHILPIVHKHCTLDHLSLDCF